MARRGRPKIPDILTPREWEVLELLRQGLSNPEIAERLGIGREGVKYHVSEILDKLGVSSREEAARWQPKTRTPGWTGALAPLAFLWSKANSSALAPALAIGMAATIAAGSGLLIWGLTATGGSTKNAGIFAATMSPPCDRLGDIPVEDIRQLPTDQHAAAIRAFESCLSQVRATMVAEVTKANVPTFPPTTPTPTLGPPPAGVRKCTASDLTGSAQVQGATAMMAGGITLKNTSESDCALIGRPRVVVTDVQGRTVPLIEGECPRCNLAFGVVVRPGETAYVAILWEARCDLAQGTLSPSDPAVPAIFLVTLPNDPAVMEARLGRPAPVICGDSRTYNSPAALEVGQFGCTKFPPAPCP